MENFRNTFSYYWQGGSASNDSNSNVKPEVKRSRTRLDSSFDLEALIENIRHDSLELDEKEFDFIENEGSYECSVLPTLHCADTDMWRKELVKAAEHNIVISGNYCGGVAFDELLEGIEKRMDEVPGLKVVIISHPGFVKDRPNDKKQPYSNIQKMNSISEKYPDRFTVVMSPDTYYGTKKVTNHTKCTVIDYGKYFIQGGSGIKDNFALTGEDNLPVELFKQQESWSDEENGKEEDSIIDLSKEKEGIITGIGSPVEEAVDEGFLAKFIPGNFRDQDFVFEDTSKGHKAGKIMYREALLLAYKWDQFAKTKGYLGNYLPSETWRIDELENQYEPADVVKKFPALSDFSREKENIEETSALYSLLESKIPDLDKVDTDVVRFDSSPRKTEKVATKLFFTGPEDSVSSFHQELVEAVKKAETEIVVDQMYFQPTKELMQAFISAAKRGVRITIITAGITKDCPNGQLFFGPRNEYNIYYLVSSLSEEERKNVDVYMYEQKKKGLHKKVVIVDDTVLAGSSNMGYKSLVLMGDHEMNFSGKSQEFVNITAMDVIQRDIELSKKVNNPEVISWKKTFTAATHSMGSRLWG